MTSECPVCKSQNLIEGELLGGGELFNLSASTFRPKAKARLLASSGIDVPNQYRVCMVCGLFWQTLDKKLLKAIGSFERVNKLL